MLAQRIAQLGGWFYHGQVSNHGRGRRNTSVLMYNPPLGGTGNYSVGVKVSVFKLQGIPLSVNLEVFGLGALLEVHRNFVRLR